MTWAPYSKSLNVRTVREVFRGVMVGVLITSIGLTEKGIGRYRSALRARVRGLVGQGDNAVMVDPSGVRKVQNLFQLLFFVHRPSSFFCLLIHHLVLDIFILSIPISELSNVLLFCSWLYNITIHSINGGPTVLVCIYSCHSRRESNQWYLQAPTPRAPLGDG